MKVLICCLLCFSFYAQAGVRSVGKGGGYAEMQAILINLKMASLTQTCSQHPSLCALNLEESSQIKDASLTGFDLQLSTNCPMVPVQIVTTQAASLATCVLYEQPVPTLSPQVKPFKDIAAWVLSARLMARLKLPLADAFQLANKVFSGSLQHETQFVIGLDHGDVLFHVLDLKLFDEEAHVLSLEGRTQTVDITETVNRVLDCNASSLEKVQIYPVGSINRGSDQTSSSEVLLDQGLIESQVTWSCRSHSQWKGTLQIFFVTEKGDVKASLVHAQVVGKYPY